MPTPKVTLSNAVQLLKVMSINLTGPNTDAVVRPVQPWNLQVFLYQ